MGTITVIKNQTAYIDPFADYTDSGWSVSDNYLVHMPCNPGYATYLGDLPFLNGHHYNVTYVIDNYVSGTVNSKLGTNLGLSNSSNGTFTDNLLYLAGSEFQFYSDGYLRITLLKISDVSQPEDNGVTISFHEKDKKWGTHWSWETEFMHKFGNRFFTFKNGALWEHNINEIYNNFYDEQYTSKITFYVNLDPETIKNFYTIRQQSTSAWGSPNNGDINIPARFGKSQGQSSRLKAGNYRSLQGDWFADFLRDLNDPRFDSDLDALFKGAPLQGKVMEITIENNSITQVRLTQLDVKTAPQLYTY